MSIFNSIKYNNTKEESQKNEIVIILSHFIENPFSISGIETEYKHFGKKAIREITRNTIYFLVVLMIAQISLNFFWLCRGESFLNTNFSKIFFHPFSVAVWLYLIPILICWFFLFLTRKLKNKSVDEYSKYLLSIENSKFKNALKSLIKYLYTIIPLTFRTIWIWTLIFGIATVFTTENIKIDFNSQVDINAFNILSSGLLKAIIISIIAYIATNVIHELLQLREQYVEGKDEMKSLKESIEIANTEMHHLLEQSKVALKYVDTSNSITKFLNDTKNKGTGISSEAFKFVAGIASLTEGMTSKIAHDEEKVLISLINSYNSMLGNQSRRVSDGDSILTTWNNLGTISKNLVETTLSNPKIFNGYEISFYALQLKSPYQFIQKYFEPNNKEWMEFINFNIANNHVNRYFAVIDETVMKDLNKEFYDNLKCGNGNFTIFKNTPYLREVESINATNVSKNLDDIFFYDEQQIKSLQSNPKKYGDKLLFQNSAANRKEIKLKDLLNDVIHKTGSCMIRNFNKIELNKLLTDTNDNTTTREKPTNKLIDYLAIRIENTTTKDEEWLFCVKSIYDEDIDTAKVEFLFKKDGDKTQNKNWEKTKEQLNEIFFLNKSNESNLTKCVKNIQNNENEYCSCNDPLNCTYPKIKNFKIIPIKDFK
ncbi:hypothetical protein [Pelodictyon phaeoclathratiforme]|jgi:hypothetical protein|uniref:Uncharacterized protein n=1 Tax=Pelodictyon phaeoclathratiforme (strain DSM 5477 / BU-1) TaxID=324925 RepID=B4SCM7_PELPB|nr:hypothetical protein [Pelodictyon phaeoclathratiforme]ACF44232.1 hypothetical protein Ppha_2021 [Pelodictyon phaeoclathratiforme BU-1]MBV5290029.1 hypothetical protein [Pelodictyon phaeoclathratiforme]